jgi:hypothetical protein
MGWHLLTSFYGLTYLFNNLDHGLYESIGVHEVPTLNLKQIYHHEVAFFIFSQLTFLFIKKIRFHCDIPSVIIFWCFFRVWVDNSWRALRPYRPFDRSWSSFVRVNWCSWSVHPRSKKTYHHASVFLKFSKLTLLFIKKLGF